MHDENNEGTEDIRTKNIELRLASVKEALHRTRSVFIIMTVASAAILFTLWNASFSRERTVAFVGLQYDALSKNSSTAPGYYCQTLENAVLPIIPEPSPEPINIFGRRQETQEWYMSRSIQVGLLGIHVSVSDLPVIGSFSLVVVGVWSFYAQRRANRALVSLLRYVTREHRDNLELRHMVFQEVRNSLLFVKTEDSDEPLEGLTSESAGEGVAKDEPDVFVPGAGDKRTFTGRVLKFLTYLPFWTIIAVLTRDLIALAMYSPTSGVNLRLGQIIWYEMRCDIDKRLSVPGQSFILMLLFELVAVVCAVYTYRLCRRSAAFSQANKVTLQEFGLSLIGEDAVTK